MVDPIHILSHVRGQAKSVRVLRNVLILVALAIAIVALVRSCALTRRLDALTQPAPVALTLYRTEALHAVPIEPVQIHAAMEGESK